MTRTAAIVSVAAFALLVATGAQSQLGVDAVKLTVVVRVKVNPTAEPETKPKTSERQEELTAPDSLLNHPSRAGSPGHVHALSAAAAASTLTDDQNQIPVFTRLFNSKAGIIISLLGLLVFSFLMIFLQTAFLQPTRTQDVI